MRFDIIATGYNCAPLVDKCVASVLKQDYVNWHLHLVNDGSTDGTNIKKWVGHEKISVHDFQENMGAAYRRMKVIRPLDAESVILLLGLDDELLPDCLSTVSEHYTKGKLMTYGNWIDQHNQKLPDTFDLDFDDETHRNRDYRKVTYRSTAPNTFKKFLFDNIPDSDFMLNGKWIDSTTESELMFSCLEMCGKDRIGIIKKPIYLYNRNLPQGTLARLGRDYKYKILDEIMKRPKKPLYKKEKLSLTVGLPVLSMSADLAMEGLCNQDFKQPWQLIVYEDADSPNGQAYYEIYLKRMPWCKKLVYIYDPDRVALSVKWREMADYMGSDLLLLQAADCYSYPNRLSDTHKAFKEGADWMHSELGYFWNIDNDKVMMFESGNGTGLNMAIRRDLLLCMPFEDVWSSVDYWLFTEASKVRDLKVGVIGKDGWDKGIDTDGRNRISLLRKENYDNPKPPFSKCNVKITDILSPEIIEIAKRPHNPVRVLNISSNDWANYSYYNSRSLQAVGINVDGMKLAPHSFEYPECLPVVSQAQMMAAIRSGKYGIIQVFNSDVSMVHFLKDYTGKVFVHHTGSGYRAKHKELNSIFDKIPHTDIIALGEFENLSGNEEDYVTIAVDVDGLKPDFELPTKPYRFLHCPSNPKVKGTDTIKRLFSKAGIPIRVDTTRMPYDESWRRMQECDIYVELYSPDLDGDKYGSFGTTAIEAASLGKVVVTQNLSKEVYKKHYGDCPLILAESEQDFVDKIKWLNSIEPKELLDLQKQHRDWAENKHSFRATGQRLKNVLGLD